MLLFPSLFTVLQCVYSSSLVEIDISITEIHSTNECLYARVTMHHTCKYRLRQETSIINYLYPSLACTVHIDKLSHPFTEQ